MHAQSQDEAEPMDAVTTKADTALVVLALDAMQTPLALEPRLALCAVGVLLDGIESPTGKLLNRIDVEMVAEPGVIELLGMRMHGVFIEAELLAKLREHLLAFASLGKLASPLVVDALAHEVEASEGLAEARIVDLTGDVKADF